MSLSVDSTNTDGYSGASERASDSVASSNSSSTDCTGPMTIRTRASGLQMTLSDGLPGDGSSGGGFPYRRLHRDLTGGSFREFRREHRSLSTDWISSPLLEGFASFHSALNGVQEDAVSTAMTPGRAPNNYDTLSHGLPYLGTCWSNDHGGESSADSSRSTQENSTMNSTDSSPATDSLVLDDWDLIKPRTFSIDVSSPVPVENLMPFMFPIDPVDASGTHAGHPSSCQTTSAVQPVVYFGGQAHLPGQSVVPSTNQGYPPVAPYSSSSSMSAHQADHLPCVPYSHWQQHHQQVTISDPNKAVLIASSPLNGSISHVGNSAATPPQHFTQQHHPHQFASQTPVSRFPSGTSSSSVPLADTQLLTKLNSCYWKNGRKNLQCFPICPEHNDFYSMKMSNRKHTSVGVCRGPVYTHVFLPAATLTPVGAKPPGNSGQHMKYEFGVGASGSGGSDYEVFVLGKFERVPQRNENDDLETLLPPPELFTSAAAFEGFRYSCFQAVEMEERRVTTATRPTDHHSSALPDHIVRSTWFFLPDVWKVQPMLKKKRKATRSAPAQAFPFCFRVLVYIREPGSASATCSSSSTDAGNGGAYRCLATTASSFFELYSTRTVDRVKRKYWGQEDGENDDEADSKPSSSRVAKRASR